MKREADVIVFDAKPWSDGACIPGADAIAVQAGQVLAIGLGSDLASLAGPKTRVLRAAGATVTPGLSDAHIHLVQWARSLDQVDLSGARTRAQALERLTTFVRQQPGSDVVTGFGWVADGWSEPPDRAALDAVCAERAVLLYSKDTHNLWLNGAALARTGIGKDTRDPQGGWIDRDGSGAPTGILRENATLLARGLTGRTADSDLERVERATGRLLAEGITAVHVFEGAEAQRTLSAYARGTDPRLRVLMHLTHAGLDHALALGLTSGVGDDRYRIGAVKLFADGTLGSRTAALLEPYDGTQACGAELIEPGELRSLVGRALAGGLSLTIHAIGDRAVRSALDAFESERERLATAALAPRIEHVQLLHPNDLPRFAALGVAASMQPIHCTSDIELASRHWAKRLDHAYPWRALADRGTLLAFGSDAPVEAPSTAHGLHAAVTRTRPDHLQPFVPAQRLALDQALTAYTEGPARLAGSWPRLGRLAPGATADLVVWNADLHASDPQTLREARPAVTVLEGEVVYEAQVAATGGVR